MALAALAVIFLLSLRSEAQIRLDRPSPTRIDVVADGSNPWRLPFFYFSYAQGLVPQLIPAGADRTLFVMGNVLHVIDTKNGLVIGRWIFPLRIDSVQVDSGRFQVRTSSAEGDDLPPETTTIEPGSAQPRYWMDQALLPQRLAVYEGAVFDEAAHFQGKLRKAPEVGMAKRQPLTPPEAERLIVDVKEAARRNPFQPRFRVVMALLMKDAGSREADSAFRQALDNPANFFAEIFPIAGDLGAVGEDEWSTLAFERGYALLWKQGLDPRLIYSMLPKLILSYLPYDLRLQIPAERRAVWTDQLYRLGPNVEWSPAAWTTVAAYFSAARDPERAALWNRRAEEAAAQSGYVWEPLFHLERALRALASLMAVVVVYYIVLQRRYAPQRRLLRQSGASPWWRLDHRISIACWDHRDRRVLFSLFLLFWLCAGLVGGISKAVVLSQSAPYFGGAMGTPRIRRFLENLPPSPERSFLVALSLQQADQLDEAARLYRTLDDSAESWNNLGVLQASQGKDREAAESFENALRIHPGMDAALFNTGRPIEGYWINQHRSYRPGQKMLALPTHDTMSRAIRGRFPQLAGNMLMGPFSGVPAASSVVKLFLDQANDYRLDLPLPVRLIIAVGKPVLYLFLTFVAFLLWSAMRAPYREVTQAPGWGHRLLELVVPGTAREWRIWGGLALGVAAYGVLESALPHLSFSGFEPLINPLSFGLPPAPLDLSGHARIAEWPAAPNGLWTYLPLVFAVSIFAANAVLVFRSRRSARTYAPEI